MARIAGVDIPNDKRSNFIDLCVRYRTSNI